MFGDAMKVLGELLTEARRIRRYVEPPEAPVTARTAKPAPAGPLLAWDASATRTATQIQLCVSSDVIVELLVGETVVATWTQAAADGPRRLQVPSFGTLRVTPSGLGDVVVACIPWR